MRPRGPLNPGPAALLLAVVFVAPEIFKRCKPLAKGLGDFLIKTGEEIHKMGKPDEPAEEAPESSKGTPEASAAPNDDVKANEGTPNTEAGKEETVKEQIVADMAEGHSETPEISVPPTDPDTVSPTGHDEHDAHEAAMAKGDGASPEPVTPIPHTDEDEDTDKENPKDPHLQ